MIKQELTPLITLTQCWDLKAWPAALTALAERMIEHYESEQATKEREEWQGGDVVADYIPSTNIS